MKCDCDVSTRYQTINKGKNGSAVCGCVLPPLTSRRALLTCTAVTVKSPPVTFLQMCTPRRYKQPWPSTKRGRWPCLCLPNGGHWWSRPPWMPTHHQVHEHMRKSVPSRAVSSSAAQNATLTRWYLFWGSRVCVHVMICDSSSTVTLLLWS